VITLLSFNGFIYLFIILIISCNFTLSLRVFVFLITLFWVDAFCYFGVVFLNSLSHVSFSPLMVLPK
jgi:hypothetical protein